MREIVFHFLNRHYNTRLENNVDVIYDYSNQCFQFYDDLVDDLKTIFAVDEDLINQYIHEWAIFDISTYVGMKRLRPSGNYSIAFGINAIASGNYSIAIGGGV